MGVNLSSEKGWRFGPFELDMRFRELRNHGAKIKLTPQVFSTLAILVEHAGDVVSRDELCRFLWPEGTYVEFEGNLNAIIGDVRAALSDSARRPRYIETEPKRGYRFIAPVSSLVDQTPSAPPPPAPAPPRRVSWTGLFLLLAGTLVVLAAFGWPWFSRTPQLKPRITQFTNYLGVEGHASFSPDGSRVAFHWNGNAQGVYNIYVKDVRSGKLDRLTNDAADDLAPQWSPDGRDIAYLRDTPGNTASELTLVSALGGISRRIAGIPRESSFVWSPDGRWIVYAASFPNYVSGTGRALGIQAISLETGKTLQITAPPHEFLGDSFPAFSPDSKVLAFLRVSSVATDDVYAVDVNRDMVQTSTPRRLTFDLRDNSDLAWLTDHELIFSSARRGSNTLWKLAVGRSPAVEFVGGENAFEPAVDLHTGRVIYSRRLLVDSLNSLPFCTANCAPETPRRRLYSEKQARNPAYSPDGRSIAFESYSSGHGEIWICDADGSNARQWTHFNGPLSGTPRWSPDGASLVFDSRATGHGKIYTMSVAGSQPKQLTSGLAEDIVPYWSHDGAWIYFASNRTGRFQIFKVRAAGGELQQVTKEGGFFAQESYDGTRLYYAKDVSRTAIWQVPVNGGKEEPVVDAVSNWVNFCLLRDGLLFVQEADQYQKIRFRPFGSRDSMVVATIESLGLQGIAVSPNGRTVLFSKRESDERDLMLMETAQ